MRFALAVFLVAAAGPLSAQITFTPITPRQQGADSGRYESAELREKVSRLAAVNARIPDSLRSYRALVETEMSVGYRDTLGNDQITQVEQTASAVRWDRLRGYDQRVVGYRSQAVGASFSLLSLLGGWTLPHLYGNRLRSGIVGDTAAQRRTAGNPGRVGVGVIPGGIYYVHPLAVDRDSVYEFSGGNVVATVRSRERVIRVARVHVRPRDDVPYEIQSFEGTLDFDADRMQLVRMRGKLVRVSPKQDYRGTSGRNLGITALAFMEFENAEISGFWLPSYQRTEMQGAVPLLGELRTIFRVVSRFRDLEPQRGSVGDEELAAADPVLQRQHRLSFAPTDSVSAFGDWTRAVGEVTADVRSDDFSDLAPERWNPTGPPRVEVRARRLGELFRFNRVEGAYTGIPVTYRFRDAYPGAEIRAHAGWAWAEGTARGALTARAPVGDYLVGARLERALEHTADFRTADFGGATLGALLSSMDDYDYVDRWSASAFGSRSTGGRRSTMATLESGAFRDRAVTVNQKRGLAEGDSGFRPLRGITEGSYWRNLVTLDYHPEVSGLFVQPGIGGQLRYDRADGFGTGPSWSRLHGSAVSRREFGSLALTGRLNAGLHIGAVEPQSLFELGDLEGLSGYDYKEFVGDRAASGRAMLVYTLPFLSAPIRLGTFILPSLSPGIGVGVGGGWSELSGDDARSAAEALVAGTGMRLPTETGRVRASVDLRLTFLRGAASIGVARPVDRNAPWKLVWSLGQAL